MKSVFGRQLPNQPVTKLTNALSFGMLEWFLEMGSVEKCINSMDMTGVSINDISAYPHLLEKLVEMGIVSR